ncbi:MAG: 4a-hydroxytetrahydrobiopterin dehydratase [Candidatus Omnitrophica bacterium]|nr:4a-hydroxytetrahydrobiopterin dehydratase [Candidatus Omnitrophota bacterium]
MSDLPLMQQKCKPCEGGAKPLNENDAEQYLKRTPDWQVTDDHKSIYRVFKMKNFLAAVKVIQSIAEIAERDNHHPDIHLTGYRNLRIELSTHSIGGLSENDFIVAAKINDLPVELKK